MGRSAKDRNATLAGARVTARERAELERAAARRGYGSVGEYLLWLHRERAKGDPASASALAEQHPADATGSDRSRRAFGAS